MDCCGDKNGKISGEDKSILWGAFSSLILIGFYVGVITLFQGIDFALLNLRSLWYLIFPLVIGFGIQIGLFVSIKQHAQLTGTVATTGGISGGSMIACCTHFLLNVIPLVGASGLVLFLMKYQPAFLSFGIISNVVGITLMVRHKNKMEEIKSG
ncbi:MAG: hypothetical protein NUV46_04065 [Nanoarchaeota archaeon]|nr:hypothetical protein [Nanoarchaeota archaeon]